MGQPGYEPAGVRRQLTDLETEQRVSVEEKEIPSCLREALKKGH